MLGLFPAAASAGVSYGTEEIAVVHLINQYRVVNGLDPVLVSDVLSDSSTKHSLDMGKHGFFSHTTVVSDWFPAGANPGVRMAACGYPAYVAYGENIAAGYPNADQVFTAWKNSEGHNKNMLDPRWRVVGIGFETVAGSDFGTYWTTDFGAYVDATAHENGQPAPPDTTAPVVTITSPRAGDDVSGTVTVAVTATDGLGVARVDLYVNGGKVASDYESPYAIMWDTRGLNPGGYTLEARASDAAGNVGSTSVLVHVSSSPSATTTTSTSTTTTTTTTTSSSTTTTTTAGSTTTSTTTPSGTTTTTQPPGGFVDVSIRSPYYQPIMTLAAAGVVTGYADGSFRPNGSVTRAQFTKIIVLALDVHTPSIDNHSHGSFSDVPYTGGPYPFDFVEEAAGLNIIRGYSDGTFAPSHNVTRLQLALMLVRAGGDGLATPPQGYACPFSDVPSYEREAVKKAYYNGLLSGKTATRFDPYSPATRGQVAKMVCGLITALGR